MEALGTFYQRIVRDMIWLFQGCFREILETDWGVVRDFQWTKTKSCLSYPLDKITNLFLGSIFVIRWS